MAHRARAGIVLLSGNSSAPTLEGTWRSDLAAGRLHAFRILDYLRGEEDQVNFVNHGFVRLRAVRSLNEELALEAFAPKGFEKFILQDDRVLVGSGVHWLVVDRPAGRPQRRRVHHRPDVEVLRVVAACGAGTALRG